MSRETLRTQLDAMGLDVQALQVENRKLKELLEGGPDRELELTQQLVQARKENLHLTKQLDEAAEQQDVNMMEQFKEHQQALGAAEENIRRLSEQLAQQETTGTPAYSIVAEETKSKWEARERKLAQHIDLLLVKVMENKESWTRG